MPSVPRPHRFTVVYDPDAALELASAVKSKEESKAIFSAVDKLRQIGEQLAPPHMKPLQGAQAGGLRELRPRQGRSDWRPVCVRRGDLYIVLAIDRDDNCAARVEPRDSRGERSSTAT